MKKKLIALLSPLALLIPSFLIINQFSNIKEADAEISYDIPLEPNEEFDYENGFFDDFDNGIDYDSWYINDRAWGQVNGRKNGGVVPGNVFYDSDEGTAILRAAGDYYAEKSITPAYNAESPYGTRTGADLVGKFKCYPGRYEVRMKVAPRFGICTALWTYIEYAETTSSGDHQNHEIDIELPWNGDFRKVSFGQYSSLSNHKSEKAVLDNPLNDGEYHTYGFDWYYSDNNKVINYYIDGVIYSRISQYVPFYRTKINLGVWIPDSGLAGTPPLFDQAYCDIDYFKYIPFKNNLHQDSDYPKSYEMNHVASEDEYPKKSTPINNRNYFPNGTFNYVNKRNQYEWLNSSITGIFNQNVEISKGYDYEGSSTSAGAYLNANNGELYSHIDSCFYGQEYYLSCNYKKGGTASIVYYNSNESVIDTVSYDLEDSSSWATFNQKISMLPNTASIDVKFNSKENGLYLDNIYLTLDEKAPVVEEERNNHFMSVFHDNPEVLNAFNTTSGTTSAKKEDLILEGLDYSSDIDWRISIGKYEAKSSDYCASITMGSESSTIAGSTDPNYSSIYNAVSSKVSLSGKQSVIYSTTAIHGLKDLSLSWNSVEAGNIYVVYKLFGDSSWSYLTNFSALAKNNGTDDKSTFNRRQLIVNSNNEDFADNLSGKTAQIGFMFSSNHTNPDVSYIRLNGLYINKIKSMKAKLNYWNENSVATCTLLKNEKSLEYTDLYFTNYDLSAAQANELNVLIEGKTITYYEQFEYLCAIAEITPNAHPSMLANSYTNVSSTSIIIICFASVSIVVALFVTKSIIDKKKKQ